MTRALSLLALFALPLLAFADPPAGRMDSNFGSADGGIPGLQLEGFDLGGSYNDFSLGIAEDAQGRLLAAGKGETDENYCLGLMRFTTNGQLDTLDFGYNENNIAKGKICHAIPMLEGHLGIDMEIAPLMDGGFLVGGTTDFAHPFVCRFLSNGGLSKNFGDGTGCIHLTQVNSGISTSAPNVLPSGDALFVVANDMNSTPTPVLIRFDLASGMTQPFGENGMLPLLSSAANAFARDARLTDDGAVIVVGSIEDDPDDADAFVARFDLQTNLPDVEFGEDGSVHFKLSEIAFGTDSLTTATILPTGHVLAAGFTEMADRDEALVVKIDAATGAMASSFNDGSPKIYDPCDAIDGGCDLQVNKVGVTDDHIVLSGKANNVMFAARLNSHGNVDDSFGEQGLALVSFADEANGMVLQDERIVLGGHVDSGEYDFALLRLSGGNLFNDDFEAKIP